MLIQQNKIVPPYVMIRNAKQPMKTDREKTAIKLVTNATSKSFYLAEREKLQQLIQLSMQNPQQMEVYLSEFLLHKNFDTNSQSTAPSRSRVTSQPHVEQKIAKSYSISPQKSLFVSRRVSQQSATADSSAKKVVSPSPKSKRAERKSMKSEQSEAKVIRLLPQNLSKLSTSALISYHKKLISNAQRQAYFQSSKKK